MNRTEAHCIRTTGTGFSGRLIFLCALFLLLAGCSGPVVPLTLKVRASERDGQVFYHLSTTLPLPENLRIALNQGLDLRLHFAARRVERGYWYRQVEQQWKQPMQLRYSALTRHYQLQHGEGWLTLAEWHDVKDELGRQQWRWPVANPGRQVEVRWWLDPASLPPSLRLQALLDDDLTFDTGWQVVSHGG